MNHIQSHVYLRELLVEAFNRRYKSAIWSSVQRLKKSLAVMTELWTKEPLIHAVVAPTANLYAIVHFTLEQAIPEHAQK